MDDCGYRHIYRRNSLWKTSFCSVIYWFIHPLIAHVIFLLFLMPSESCQIIKIFKETTKLYFMYSLFAVIILCNADPYKSAFSTYSFIELVFRLVFCFLFILF